MEKANYEEYATIKIDSLSFLWANSRNRSFYNRLQLNNIETLQDLFIKYDNNSIVFPDHDKEANAQARAIIEMIRYKYLKCDTLLDPLLEEKLIPFVITRFETKGLSITTSKFRAIGLEHKQAASLARFFSKIAKEPTVLGEFLIEYFNNNYRYIGIGKNELEDLRIKLSILISYYNMKKASKLNNEEYDDLIIEDMTLKSLEEVEQELLTRRDNLDKKIEMIRSQIDYLKQIEKTGKKL